MSNNYLSIQIVEYNNTSLLKKHSIFCDKQENILEKLAFMSAFEELSCWIERHTNGQRYIACPAHSSREDRDSCLNGLQELLFQAIQGRNIRKDGRDLKLIKASETKDYYTIANILASAAWSYWQTYYLSNGNAAFYAKNHQESQKIINLKKAQIDYIGAAVSFKKAHKKGAFQETLDFFETEEILQNLEVE